MEKKHRNTGKRTNKSFLTFDGKPPAPAKLKADWLSQPHIPYRVRHETHISQRLQENTDSHQLADSLDAELLCVSQKIQQHCLFLPFSTELPAAATGPKALTPSRLFFRDWTSCLHLNLLAHKRVRTTASVLDTRYLQHLLP
ncbi:hypothetical protein E2C01_015865 [Portunus trituberculatus]|uniref:Uncharacterized protein n=1 Tax=Portunus trituberculatus TaxID=210409 RepID=A0A5B7DN17_PORTR|nr:hypothetical protein [Portunus trituberculatus]